MASRRRSGPEVIKLFSCSTQLSMKFFLFINVKMPTIVGILICMSGKNNILCLTELNKSRISWFFHTYEDLKFRAQLSWAWKSFITPGPGKRAEAGTSVKYLGAVISYHGSKPEVLSRVAQATAALKSGIQFGEIATYLLDHRWKSKHSLVISINSACL